MKKILINTFFILSFFIIVLIFCFSFIRIEKYHKCVLNNFEVSSIVVDNSIYNEIKGFKELEIITENKQLKKRINYFKKQDEYYLCILETINELEKDLINISIKLRSKTFFEL